MRLSPLALLPAALLIGCTTVQDSFSDQLSASGVDVISASLDSSSLSYTGQSTEMFTIDGRSWGMATKRDRAEDRLSGNEYSYGLSGNALLLASSSDAGLAGVDFDIFGPAAMNTSLNIESGSVDLSNMIGYQQVTADRIDVTDLYGSVDLLATSGSIDAEVFPGPGDSVRVESWSGDVELTLPWGGAYDIQVWGDPEYSMLVEDLGFYSSATAPAYFAGVSGSGATRVDVFVTGGSVTVRSAW
ncbi:MAG: hypothetical protein P8R54_32020 [Myxococcota bacterium]|nr:hypothetical protein [Myxococcota bacterium]